MTLADMTLASEAPTATPQAGATRERDLRWAAVTGRDASHDGQFVYSVKTTGVYCRPSCPSRRANRANVAFHDSPVEAERAGFRACRRCRPNETAGLHAAAIERACRSLERAEDAPSLSMLAATAGLSAFHFHRVFKLATGLTPRAYAAVCRTRRVRDALSDPCNSVTGAIYEAGYGSSGRFYAASNGSLGMTPRAFRDGGDGTAIRVAVGECSLGSVLVAQSDKGICAITIGDDPDALLRDLQDRFPKARLIGGDSAFEHVVATVVGFIEAPAKGLDLPLDIRGTAFQRRVWQALRAIPAGRTDTYAEIAATLGAPKSVRAVAGACAANAIAVAIPCHRVIRTDGSLSGYRWGIARKRALLDREAQG